MSLNIPPQREGPLDEGGLFGRVWYLFLNAVALAVNTLSAGAVLGQTALTNPGKLTKVGAAGTLAESAVTDDGTNVLIAGRGMVLDNGKILSQKSAAGVVRNLITHFTDDVVYIQNADGSIFLGPKAGSPVSVGTDVDVTGVYKKGGVAGITVTITTAKLTAGGVNGSQTFSGGILTAQTQAT